MEKWTTAITLEADLERFSDLRQEIAHFFYLDKGHQATDGALKGYFLSRLALSRALKLYGLKADWRELRFEGHGILTNFPDLRCSLSHTKNLAIAIVSQKNESQSVGIDVEWSVREVKIGSEKYFINDEDDRNWTMLELWCLKEAAFKALSPLCPELKLAKNITINEKQFSYNQHKGLVHIFMSDTLVAIATILA